MKTKPSRTKIANLSKQPRALDLDELADVTGGLMRAPIGGVGTSPGCGPVDTWTWTEPCGPDDIYKKDDE